jgi:hypothetical protein
VQALQHRGLELAVVAQERRVELDDEFSPTKATSAVPSSGCVTAAAE